jgi:hypothetical protein
MRLISRRDTLKSVPALACALAIPQVGVARAEQATTAIAPFDFADLKTRFSGELISRDSAAYETARRSENLAFDRHPLLVAKCADAEDAARAFDFARCHGLPIAVRG